MSKPESRTTETIVGLFILIGLAVISVLVFTIAGKQKLFEPRYRLTALFSQVGGLKVGSPVRLAGLEVGNVESLDFTADGKVLAVLSIQTRYQEQIRGDSVATISSVGILGDKSVEIMIGSKEKMIIPNGAGIPSKDPFDIAGVVDQLSPMVAKVDQILTHLSRITGEFSMEKIPMAAALEHADNILKKVDQGKGSIGSAVNDPALYNEFVSLVRSGSEAAEALKKTMAGIEPASADLPALMDSTRKAMEDISAVSRDLHKSSEHFPEITLRVDETTKNLLTASRDLPAISGSFRNAARGAEDVMESAKRNRLIRGNLPERPTVEERILLEASPFHDQETEP